MRTGTTIMGIPRRCRRFWTMKAVSLCSARFRVFLEDELASDEERAGIAGGELGGGFFDLDLDLRADREHAGGGQAERARVVLVTEQVLARALLESRELVGAFERLGVDHRDAQEHDAREMVREHAQQREQRVATKSSSRSRELDQRSFGKRWIISSSHAPDECDYQRSVPKSLGALRVAFCYPTKQRSTTLLLLCKIHRE
jgi:hypothetical protein